MTIEHSLIVGVEDIRGIQIECASCKARVTRSPDKPFTLPNACGSCGTSWPVSFGDDSATTKLIRLIAALRGSPSEGYKLRFEFDGKVMA